MAFFFLNVIQVPLNILVAIIIITFIIIFRKQIAQNGHANIVDEINNNEEFVKKRLRKTNVDWTTGTLRKKATHETQQFDFRSMLKKTGRLEKELETK